MSSKKTALLAIILLAIIAAGWFFFFRSSKPEAPAPAPVAEEKYPRAGVIGKSVEGRDIESFAYGSGKKHVVFVGGVHGGYEWNSVLLAYRFMDYLAENPSAVPAGVTVTVIPDANPDAVYAVTGQEGRFDESDVSKDSKVLAAARFNANDVDLNRNFDCKWQPKSTWQSKTVSAGSATFSEPEALALKRFFAKDDPSAVVFWHSQANAVYASQCGQGILPGTLDIMNAYAKASGYKAVKEFDAYATTGAADDWLASVDVPAITVELSSHDAIEWEKNLPGIKALLAYIAPANQ